MRNLLLFIILVGSVLAPAYGQWGQPPTPSHLTSLYDSKIIKAFNDGNDGVFVFFSVVTNADPPEVWMQHVDKKGNKLIPGNGIMLLGQGEIGGGHGETYYLNEFDAIQTMDGNLLISWNYRAQNASERKRMLRKISVQGAIIWSKTYGYNYGSPSLIRVLELNDGRVISSYGGNDFFLHDASGEPLDTIYEGQEYGFIQDMYLEGSMLVMIRLREHSAKRDVGYTRYMVDNNFALSSNFLQEGLPIYPAHIEYKTSHDGGLIVWVENANTFDAKLRACRFDIETGDELWTKTISSTYTLKTIIGFFLDDSDAHIFWQSQTSGDFTSEFLFQSVSMNGSFNFISQGKTLLTDPYETKGLGTCLTKVRWAAHQNDGFLLGYEFLAYDDVIHYCGMKVSTSGVIASDPEFRLALLNYNTGLSVANIPVNDGDSTVSIWSNFGLWGSKLLRDPWPVSVDEVQASNDAFVQRNRHLTFSEQAASIEVYNLVGQRLMYSENESELEISSSIPSGVYLLRFTIGTEDYTSKVFVP